MSNSYWDAATANKALNLYDIAIEYGVVFKYGNAQNGFNASSIFRKDSNPSFTVYNDKGQWKFNDKGGHGVGSALDFIMLVEHLDFSKALEFANQKYNDNYKVFTPIISDKKTLSKEDIADEKRKEIPQSNMAITAVRELNNNILLQYIASRKIDINIAKKYLKEIYYSIEIKEKISNFFGVCFENRIGGYEIRNANFKGGNGNKDITIIKGLSSEKIILVEGWASALSALTFYKSEVPKYDMIVMNSIINARKVIEYINAGDINEIFDLLDNDFGGQSTILKIKAQIKAQIKITDTFKVYQGFKDFNEFICK